MASFANNKELYDRLSENIMLNIESINNLLTDCSIRSIAASEELQGKFSDFEAINTNDFIKDQPKDDYYDLDEVAKIFEMLDVKRKGSKSRSETCPNLPIEDELQSFHGQDLVSSQLKEIRAVLRNIRPSTIKLPDISAIQANSKASENNFIDLVLNLQKFAKELQDIANTDNADIASSQPPIIEKKLIEELKLLSKVS